MENTPNPAPNPAPNPITNAPNTPPVSPATNPPVNLSANPAPSYQLPQSPVSSPPPAPVSTPVLPPGPTPALSPVATAFKAAGFFSGKVLVSLVAVVVVGGGLAAGYFLFPEPFYNSVGKYLGLPAPSEEAESETEKDEVNAAADEIETREAASKDTSLSELFEALPGADANFIMVFQSTEEAKQIIDELISEAEKTYGEEIGEFRKLTGKLDEVKKLSTDGIPQGRELLEITKNVSSVVMVAKIDPEKIKTTRADLSDPFQNIFPSASAVQLPSEKAARLLEIVEELKNIPAPEGETEENPFQKIRIEGKGNGIILISNNLPLEGKLIDNQLMASASDIFTSNVGFAIDVGEMAKNAIQEMDAAIEKDPQDEDMQKRIARIYGGSFEEAKQFVDMVKNTKYAVLATALKKENTKAVFSLSISVVMTDEASASRIVSSVPAQIQGVLMFIPSEYQSFLKTNFTADSNTAKFEFRIEDLVTLEKKLIEMFLTINTMGKPFDDESPADLPNLNELESSILEELTRSDIPGAPIGGIERMEDGEPAVSSGKIRRIKK